MSDALPPTPTEPSVKEEARQLSLRQIARAWPRAIVTAWAIVAVLLLSRVLGDPGVTISGDADGLIPSEHRPPEGEPLLLLRVDDATLDPEQDGTDRLLTAASSVAERLGPRRVPLGPPAAELSGWLDAHALYLLPVEAHEALAEQLGDAAMTSAVDALKARLSSPLYGVSGEEPRRDPLRLQELSRSHAGRMTHLGNAEDMPAELTATGDLLALDGRTLLVQLRSDDDPRALQTEIDATLEGQGIDAALVGPGPRRERARLTIQGAWSRLMVLGLAGLVLVLSLALRAIRPVLAIVLALLTALVGMLAFGPPVDLHGLPMLVLLVGFGCEGAMHLSRISPRGWPAAAVLGTALLPLLLSPYPSWQGWALVWLAGVALVVALLRLVVPALLILLRFSPTPARRGVRLRPLRPLAVVLAMAALASGAWAIERIPFAALDATPRPAAEEQADRRVREGFFDPRLVAVAESQGDTPALALERAAEHARQLASLVPADAARIDSPGRLVLPPSELQSRHLSLVEMKLSERMDALRTLLVTRGFHPDAFGEFLRGAADLDVLPTPQAALDGPLGDWIRGYLHKDEKDGRPTLVSRVHLHAEASGLVPALQVDDEAPLHLRGPAVAARRDRDAFPDRLGITLALQLWLGALVVWLATRRLAAAIACSVAALCTQTAVMAAMVPMGLSLGPALLPALLLVGAAATIAGARACRALSLDEPFYGTGVLLSSLCQVVAGLTLIASADPLWSPVGTVVALGAVLAAGAGLFIAPGMFRLFGGSEAS